MIFDGYVQQLPDTDPVETQEWLDSLDAVIDTHGKTRARFLLPRHGEHAVRQHDPTRAGTVVPR
jgi:pyruvate dehydrogenase E1 component